MSEQPKQAAPEPDSHHDVTLSGLEELSGIDIEADLAVPKSNGHASNGHTPKGPAQASPTSTAADFQKTVVPGLVDKQRYKVTGEFARGGMGRILLAFDRATGREVAIKELIGSAHAADPIPAGGKLEATGPTMMGGPSMVQGGQPALTSPPPDDITIERFLREAKITSRLEHPNIVPVYEIAQRPDGVWYYSMKFVRGVTLGKKLRDIARNGQLDEKAKREERLKLLGPFVDVCHAIAYADSKGVVHRDLKPENIMLGEFGETVILDWGLARVEGEDLKAASQLLSSKGLKTRGAKSKPNAADTPGRSSSRLTLDGSVIGTPSYMPPEQAMGKLEHVDHCSDVYSLGAILYEILSGIRAYPGEDAFDILDAVLAGPPKPLAQVSTDVPPELVAVVEKAMAREKPDRFATARQLASEVEAWRNGRAVASYKYSTGEQIRRVVKRHRAIVATVTAAMLVLLIGGAIALYSINAEKNEAERQAAAASAAKVEALGHAKSAEEAKSKAESVSSELVAEKTAREELEAAAANRYLRIREERKQEYGHRVAAAEAASPLADRQSAAEQLVLAWETAGYPEPTKELRQVHDQAMQALNSVIGELEGALALATEPIDGRPPMLFAADNKAGDAKLLGIERDRLNAAKLVSVKLCTANGDYALARYLLGWAAFTGLAQERFGLEMAGIGAAEGARLAHRRERIEFVLDDVEKGIGREGRPWNGKLLDDYVFELIQYKDEQTAELLGAALLVQAKKAGWEEGGRPRPPAGGMGANGGTSNPAGDQEDKGSQAGLPAPPDKAGEGARPPEEEMAGGGARPPEEEKTREGAHPPQTTKEVLWTQEERDLVTLCCRVLGRVGLGEHAVRALTPFSEVVLDHALAVEVGLALGYTGHGSAWGPILRFRNRFGVNSSAYTATHFSHRSLPPPPLSAKADAAAFSNRGTARLSMGDIEGAIADFDRALELDPRDALVFGNRGNARSELGDLPGAIADYDRAIELDPEDSLTFNNRARVRSFLGDLAGAVADYDRAIELDPTSTLALSNRAGVRRAMGDLKGAIADSDRVIELDPKHVAAFNTRGQARRDIGDLPGAIADFDRAIELNPKHALAFMNRGNARKGMGDLPGAVSDYDRAIELDPKFAGAFCNRGFARVAMGDLAGAISDYDRAIELDPKLAQAFINRGIAREDIGDLQGAIADLDRAIELDPKNANAFNNRGGARFHMGDLKGAIADFDRAIELDPKNANAFNNRGTTRSHMGDHSGAIADYDRAIELDPKDAYAYANRGLAKRQMGEIEASIADLGAAARLMPTNPRIAKELATSRGMLEAKPWLTKEATRAAEHFEKSRAHAAFAPIEKDNGHWEVAERQCLKGLEGIEADEGILRSAQDDPEGESARLLRSAAATCDALGRGLLTDDQYARSVTWYARAIEFRQWLASAAGTAYNVACAAALAGEEGGTHQAEGDKKEVGEGTYSPQWYTDKAFDWLNLAAELGWANAQHASADPDLKSLHPDPRWEAVMEKLKANAKKAAEKKDDVKPSTPAPSGE